MQFKPAMIEAIKAGRKTQTRRPMKLGDFILWNGPPHRVGAQVTMICDQMGHIRWRLGGRYSICPGRGKPRIGIIQVIRMRSDCVGQISAQDALAEGLESRDVFFAAWKNLYPKSDLQENVWVLEFRLA